MPRVLALVRAVAAEEIWIGAQPGFDEQRFLEFFRELVGGGAGTVLVAIGDGDRHLGHLSLATERYGVARLGMMVDAEWRGQGLGRALVDAAVAWARDEAGVHKITLTLWPHNVAAYSLYRNAGFSVEGRRRAHYRRRNGEVWDAIDMGLLVDESVPRSTQDADVGIDLPSDWL